MTDMVLTRGQDGKLAGLTEKDDRAYGRFIARAKGLAEGDTLAFSYKLPRSPRHHRLFFAQIGNVFESQERFEDDRQLRTWLTVGAGYCDMVPGPDGGLVAIPMSIAWTEMDETEFGELHAAVLRFLWTAYARKFLWAHQSDEQSYRGLAVLLGEEA
jgi:hypothetical protein